LGIGIIEVSHVNVTVTADSEQAAKAFYRDVLGLTQIPKPKGPRQFIGAWYQLGGTQLHLSIEDNPQNESSDRHVCYSVEDVAVAAATFRDAGIEVIPDKQATGQSSRFFVRDPGGNLIEITERPAA
jgi:catechol 2,3-dioxygenase-like lactoylglutathione lyase family enzyme